MRYAMQEQRTTKPILSVILPAFNCEGYVAQAIESILHQTFQDFELLVADDGSSDNTRKVIEQYGALDPRIRQFTNSNNRGKVWTVNKLLNFCVGEFVTVHDADDCSLRERFEKQINFMIENPASVMCGTSFRMINADGTLFRSVVMPSDFEQILSSIRFNSQFHGPTMVIRMSALQGCLYRSFFLEYNEDCDLAFRLVEKGYCTNLSEILYTYRILPNSLSKRITAKKRNLYKMAARFHEQRRLSGKDDLMEGRDQEIDRMLQVLMRPYIKDSSLIHRENAAFLMYYRLNKQAIYNAWKAWRLNPFRFRNLRTLQYCVRKTVIGI